MQTKTENITDFFIRLTQMVDYKNISLNKMSQDIGVSNSYFNKMIKNNGSVGHEILTKIVEFYEISPDWLLTGKGDMLRASNKTSVDLPEYSNKLIPFFDSEAEAGIMKISDMSAIEEPAEMIDAGDWFRDADCAMRVHGDSMFPVYKSGSIVVMKQVLNKNLVIFGQDYVVQTSEYRVIKRLQKSGKPNCWLACSVNDEVWQVGEMKGRLIHEPFDIEIEEANKLFRVLGSVTRNESSRVVYNK
jgi:phage repressor protein C with HTH and peptisase S24 domain